MATVVGKPRMIVTPKAPRIVTRKLSTRQIVCYETASFVRDRGKLKLVMAEMHPGFMDLRAKGRKKRFALPFDTAYRTAVLAEVESERRARREKRMKKQKGETSDGIL